MRFLVLTSLAVFLSLSAVEVQAQTYEPQRGSSERNAILDIGRAEVRESGLRGNVRFYGVWMRRSGDWAFMKAEIRRPNGSYIFDTDPDYCDADAMIEILLRRQGNGWRVVSGDGAETQYCVSDFAGYNWYVENYNAPRSLFPPSPY